MHGPQESDINRDDDCEMEAEQYKEAKRERVAPAYQQRLGAPPIFQRIDINSDDDSEMEAEHSA